MQTQRVKGSTRWNRNVDFFGMFDIIAFNDYRWYLVQVKSQYLNKDKNDLKNWVEKYKPVNCEIRLVIRNKGKVVHRWREIII